MQATQSTQEKSNTQDSEVKIWAQIKKDYDLGKKLGSGSYGKVYQAKNKKTGQRVAIKYVEEFHKDTHSVRRMIREVIIMRKFSEIQTNIFTVPLLDLIFPEGVITEEETKDAKGETVIKEVINTTLFTHIFMVLEEGQLDIKKMMDDIPGDLEDGHIITILYNILCATQFMHSANIIHRDIKPANILINSDCEVKICDFGLSRALPKRETHEQEINSYLKSRNPCEMDKTKRNEFKKGVVKILNDNKKARNDKTRDLTPTIQTRHYRAPEIILTDRNYDLASDVWSIGLILVEFLRVMDQKGQHKRRWLFNGNSCYPISPANSQDEHQVDINDQLIKITERFPKIKKDVDLSFISSPDSVEYMTQLMQRVEKKDPISKMFPSSNSKLVALAQQMLEFNPYFRPTCKQLLENPIFDSVRQPLNQEAAPFKIKLGVDKGEYAVDYVDCNESDQIKQKLLKILAREHKYYKKDSELISEKEKQE